MNLELVIRNYLEIVLRMKNSFLLLLVLVFFGCLDRGEQVEYIGLDSFSDNRIEISGNVLNGDFVFSWPSEIIIVDSLLIIHDFHMQNYGLHIFRRSDGTFIKSFGARGRGPGELLSISSLSVNDNGVLIAYDANSRRVMKYDLHKLLNNETYYYEEFSIPERLSYFVSNMFSCGDNYLMTSYYEHFRYGIYNKLKDSVFSIYAQFPSFTDDEEINRAIVEYGVLEISPNKQYLLNATYVGATIELFCLNDCSLDLKKALHISKPQYNEVEGTSPKWVNPTEECIIGTEDAFITNDAVYTLFWGVPNNALEISKPYIVQYDYDLSIKKIFETREVVGAFAVEGDCMYAVACDDDGEYKLYTYSIE